LADACGGELLIVHAIPEISEAMLMVYGRDDSGQVELLPEAARRRICSMAATLNISYRVKAKIGDVADIVRRFAKQWRADVVVAGRGRRTDRWQLGANIARSPCPVIAVSGAARAIRRHAGSVRRLVTLPAPRPNGALVHCLPRLIPV
jgi:nucleotide-binding universal stress UspA family protein